MFRGTTTTGCHAIITNSDSIRLHYYATSPFGINVQALSQLCKDYEDISIALFGKHMQFYEEEAEVMVPRDIPGCNITRVYYNGQKVEQPNPNNPPPLDQLEFRAVDARLLQTLADQRCCEPFHPSPPS